MNPSGGLANGGQATFWNLFKVCPWARKARGRALLGFANPRRDVTPACALQPIPNRTCLLRPDFERVLKIRLFPQMFRLTGFCYYFCTSFLHSGA